MGEGGNFQNESKLRGANKLIWEEKIDNSVMDPPTIREGRVHQEIKGLDKSHRLISVKLQILT